MGVGSSRVDVELIQENVFKLIEKTNKNETKINKYIKDQIMRALRIYSKQINEIKSHNYRKLKELNGLIDSAASKLHCLPINEDKLRNIPTGTDNPETIKSYIFEVKKKIQNNEISPQQYENILRYVVEYSLKLNTLISAEDTKWKEFKREISILILEIFVKIPNSDVFEQRKNNNEAFLEKVSGDLNALAESFKNMDMKTLPISSGIKATLENIKLKIKIIDQATQQAYEEIERLCGNPNTKQESAENQENPSSSFQNSESTFDGEKNVNKHVIDYTDYFDNIEKTLNEYETQIQNLYPPISDSLLNEIAKEIFDLKKYLEKSEADRDTFEKKESLLLKIDEILNKLKILQSENKQTIKFLNLLEDIECKIGSIPESSCNLEEKKNMLMKQLERAVAINSNNEKVNAKRSKILNRIQVLIDLESLYCLKQIRKTIDQHKIYAQQFAYPKSNPIYEQKRNEIMQLKNISVEDQFGITRRLYDKIDKVLEILDQKANNNEEIIRILKFLENIEKSVIYWNGSDLNPLHKLHEFNKIRSNIASYFVDNLCGRIYSKKIAIYSKIHHFENSIYIKCLSTDLTEIKLTLDKQEEDVQQFNYSETSEKYQQKREELIAIEKKLQYIPSDNSTIFNIKHIFQTTIDIILNVLERRAKENKDKLESLEHLNIIHNSITIVSESNTELQKKLEKLNTYEELIRSMKKRVRELEVLKQIDHVEENILIAKSKIQMIQIKLKLDQIKEISTMPSFSSTKNDNHNNVIAKIMSLKFLVEDTLEGNPELDKHKQILMEEIYKCIQNLDEYIAKIVRAEEQTSNILDLQGYFNRFDPNNVSNIPKDSIEFVRIIKNAAATFEINVRDYLGTNYSVEYYVIHENLMRLLEELDQLNCVHDEDFLKETVATMEYIKGLIAQLELNAADD